MYNNISDKNTHLFELLNEIMAKLKAMKSASNSKYPLELDLTGIP